MIVKDPDVTVTEFSCLQWVSGDENVVADKLVTCATTSFLFVARLEGESDILVGSSDMAYIKIWKNVTENQYTEYNSGKVLQIQRWCSANWIPFVPGNPVPASAVVGGCLGDEHSVKTYVISGSTDTSYTPCGYYNPDTKLGYVPYNEPEMITNMNILVLYKK